MEQTTRVEDSRHVLLALESAIEETSAFLKRHGINKPAYISEKNRQIFLSWPVARLEKTTTTALKILKVHLEAEKNPLFDLDDSSQLLVIALRELSLKVDPEFYKYIDRNDVLEVYDSEHFQMFRSFNFFRICNYSLDDILAHEWYELFERPESITKDLIGWILEHLASQRSISKNGLGEHLMRERWAEPRGNFITTVRHLGSVYAGPEKKPGYLATISVKQLTQAAMTNVDLLTKRDQ
jgi:hypothetical protein